MQLPKDYAERASERNRRFKEKTTTKQRIFLGFGIVALIFVALALVQPCG